MLSVHTFDISFCERGPCLDPAWPDLGLPAFELLTATQFSKTRRFKQHLTLNHNSQVSPNRMSDFIIAPINDANTYVVVAAAAIGALIALLMALINTRTVRAAPMCQENPTGDYVKIAKDMVRIAEEIQKGARSFLKTEYAYLTGFVVIFAIILFALFAVQNGVLSGVRYACCFLGGSILSATSGWFGMIIATDSNVRTAHAADNKGLNSALQIAFAGGSVMGFTVVGLGLFGVVVGFFLMTLGQDNEGLDVYKEAMLYMTGFGFGASSIALFARVAGGIYTKAADVGADLVGKVESGLPEDDPRNPAVIADNVGDNVGDVAGMGADLFESYVGSIIAAGSLASSYAEVALPLWIAGCGVLCAAIGSKFVTTKEGATQSQLLASLKRATWVSCFLSIGLTAVCIHFLQLSWNLFFCMVIGLICGEFVGIATEYFTSYAYSPVKSIVKSGVTGPATVIIQGLGVGMLSCFPVVLLIVIAIVSCNLLSGGYGIAIAAVGMLSTLGVTLATDAYGPVADNAGGIAEMAHMPERVREITDSLDALGNTTAATGKGFAIGSAVLTALSLLASFKKESGLGDTPTDITDPIVLGGLLFGAVLPFVFAALTMLSVRKAATSIILEVRRQFKECPELKDPDTTLLPDYHTCIAISTQSSVEEMILPGALAILMPVTIGFLVGPRCLSGLLSGAIASGCMLAVMMSNAGGAWDNAKKYMELEANQKHTPEHDAAVIGDTVGDPFKDTSGPALNILIKLMSMVSLVISPLLTAEDWATWQIGIIPLVVMILVTIVVYLKFWKGFEEKTEAKHKSLDAMGDYAKPGEAEMATV